MAYLIRMRFTVSPEQLKFFQTHCYLTLENLLTAEQATQLLCSINGIRQKSPGYVEENLFRSIPEIVALTRKRGWGEIAYELIQKKPLRIGYDAFFCSSCLLHSVGKNECGLILNLHSCSGLFFKENIPQKSEWQESNLYNYCYFLVVFTAQFLPEPMNPVILL